MFLQNKRGCIGVTILLLALFVIRSARAAAVQQPTGVDATSVELHGQHASPTTSSASIVNSANNTANRHTTSSDDTKNKEGILKLSLNKPGVINTNVIDATVDYSSENVEIRLADVQQMIFEYLDENLPVANDAAVQQNDSSANDARAMTSTDGVSRRSNTRNQLFERLIKFAERYIHPDISKAVTTSGRVFLFKGNFWCRAYDCRPSYAASLHFHVSIFNS